ncbi:hypothetical protein P170DRAFT_473578 [Aspergillus steynii IBT 23096]|uniref:PHD-type domain-containing protein n=1 Tax=Aspergillus steynii IBT 23096 TaxID=1392250 RepID=A0A2I2GAW4_9EURO|nr:uncharacterized protein P170DRAFT_473578 [Aspergillus steynii IBT 23096]PLB50005.1 hypothetical protein P170DRAFT_473578 [Aspergillus steynii IBT 23096]
MLRTPPDTSGLPQPRMLQEGSPRQYNPPGRKRPVRHMATDFGTSSVSGAEKRRIYDEWTRAGKPHNLICSQCRKPDDLIPCETCCRSYHAACLMLGGLSPHAGAFHCPSCRRNQWDQSLQFDTPLQSSNVSPSSTPSGNGSRVTSPSVYMAFDHRSPLDSPGSTMYPQNFRQLDHSIPVQPAFASQARDFLMSNGQFPAHQEFPPELLSRLGSMMAALETQRSLQDEIRNLKEENATLRNDNANMRDYFNSNLPTREPMIAAQPSDMSDTPKVTDTSEKAWDRIMYDII